MDQGLIGKLAEYAGEMKRVLDNLSRRNKQNDKLQRQEVIDYLSFLRNKLTEDGVENIDSFKISYLNELIPQVVVFYLLNFILPSKNIEITSNLDTNRVFLHTIQSIPKNLFMRSILLDPTNNPSPILRMSICQKIIEEIRSARDSTRFDEREEAAKLNFYDKFLAAYDKESAKDRGVVYTPSEIVDFMLSSVHFLLHVAFSIEEGLLDTNQKLHIADPAAGTMAFGCGILRYAGKILDYSIESENYIESYLEWLENGFLMNFSAYEILPIPIIIGIIRIQIAALERINCKLDRSEYERYESRITRALLRGLALKQKNTLESNEQFGSGVSFKHIHKSEKNKISIVIGNPPYNISTENNSKLIQRLIKDYKKDLREKNLKILSDDYVKFIRYGQWKIESSGKGMVAFITNNNYLDGAVFKIMRRSLMQTFDKIYIVDLHGNMRKGESGNPFDIRVGVAIGFFLRTSTMHRDAKKCKIFYWDVPSNNRDDKFKEISSGFEETKFEPVPPTPDYYFIPKDIEKELRFYDFAGVRDFFKEEPKSGIMTGRDALVSNPDRILLEENIALFFNREFDKLNKMRVKIRKTKSWDPEDALQKSSKNQAKRSIVEYNYRGLDKRFLIYDNALVEGCRLGFIDQIKADNPAIAVTRSIRSDRFNHALMVANPVEKCFMAVKDSSYIFPMKLPDDSGTLHLNITTDKTELPFKIDEDGLFYYIYGVLYSDTYRSRYSEQLKKHYPRIPLPSGADAVKSKEIFMEMSNLGRKLGEIHTGTSYMIDISQYPVEGGQDYRIQGYYYNEDEERIYINKDVWISNIPEDLWTFEMGTRSQLKIWLKERKFVDPKSEKTNPKKRHKGLRRELSAAELEQLLRIVSKIDLTIQLLPEIDKVYQKIDLI